MGQKESRINMRRYGQIRSAAPFRARKTGKGRYLFLLLCAALLLLLPAAHAAEEKQGHGINASGNQNVPLAVDPMEEGEGYSAILYDNRNGLPTSEANAIAQTEEGFIWIGSYAGLIRYDGNTFELIQSPEGILNTRCLFVDGAGRLWVGTNDYGVFLMNGGQLQRVDRDGQLVSVSIRAVAEGTDGLIYIGTASGMAVVNEYLNLQQVVDERLTAQTVHELRLGSDGRMYGLTQSGDLFAMQEGKVVSWYSHEQTDTVILSMLPDFTREGAMYMAVEDAETGHALIYRGMPDEAPSSWEVYDAAPLSFIDSMEEIDGDIWICASNGAGKLNKEGKVTCCEHLPMDKSVGHVMTDYEGNLWFTSIRQCVMKVVPNRFQDLFSLWGLKEDVVNTTCILDDQLFIGTDDMGLMVVKDGKALETLPLTGARTASGKDAGTDDLIAYLKEERVRSIVRDAEGRLWISTFRHGHGLVCYDHGEMTVYTREDGLLSDSVRTVYICEDGTVLAAQPDGVSLIRDGKVVKNYGAEDGLNVTAILTAAEGSNGDLLFGSDGGGIYVAGEQGIRQIGLKDGLKSEVILRIKRSTTKDMYWIVTGNSIAFMTPDYHVTTVENFPYSNNYDFYESSKGEMWVLSSNGIYVAKVDEMLKNQDISTVYCGIASGLPYIATSNAFSELTPEGDLYMAGVKGAVRFNINRDLEDLSNLKIALPWIEADGKFIYPDENGAFSVPCSVRRITITPYVFYYSLMDPEVSWHLEGFDAEKTTVLRSRMSPVTYTNLREGTYRFVIRVNDPIGASSVSESFVIVREKNLTDSAVGSIIMDTASLFLLAGVLFYSSMQRRRKRTDDQLFFAMTISVMVMAVGEMLSYALEGREESFYRDAAYAANLVYYAGLETFPYIFTLYMDYRVHRDRARIRKLKIAYVIPVDLVFIFIVMSVSTGLVFYLTETNVYATGPMHFLVYVPVLFYFVVVQFKAFKVSPILVVLSCILLLSRILLDVFVAGISSTVLFFTLILMCSHIQALNSSAMHEEAT